MTPPTYYVNALRVHGRPQDVILDFKLGSPEEDDIPSQDWPTQARIIMSWEQFKSLIPLFSETVAQAESNIGIIPAVNFRGPDV